MRTRRKILAVMALSGAVAGIGGASQDGDFRHTLDPRGLTAAGYGYAGIVIAALAPLQPVRGRARRVPARRPAERGLHAAGRRLPVGSRRRDAGADPLLRARRRAAGPLPGPLRRHAARRGTAASLGGGRHEQLVLVVVLASAVAYGTPLLFAALGELLAERSGVLNLGVEGMMLVGAVMGFWAVQRTPGSLVALAIARRRGRRRRDGADPRLPRDHAAREPDRVGARADDLRRRGRALVVPRQRPQPRRRSRRGTRSRRSCRTAGRRRRSSGRSCSTRPRSSTPRGLCVVLVALYLNRTRPGLNVRAVGESPAAADAMGINVTALPLRAHDRRRRARRRRRRRRSRSRSRRSGSTGSRAARAGSRSRSSSSRSGGRRCASSARTSSARSRALPFTLQARGILRASRPSSSRRCRT